MIPTIEQYMTPTPHTVGADQTLETAAEMMRAFGVRHLPVRDQGKLVGVLSARDLERAEAAHDARRLYTPVSEIMRASAWCVPPDAPLVDVVREMAERKVGSVLVGTDDRVIGIFTSVDAARVLADLVEAVQRAPSASLG